MPHPTNIFELQYRLKDNPESVVTVTDINDTAYVITGVLSDTDYEWRVRGQPGSAHPYEFIWSPWFQVRTLSPPVDGTCNYQVDSYWRDRIAIDWKSLAFIDADNRLWCRGIETDGWSLIQPEQTWTKVVGNTLYDAYFALRSDGTIWAFGGSSGTDLNLFGGTTKNARDYYWPPFQLSGTGWRDFTYSYDRIVLAIGSDGTLWACGHNNFSFNSLLGQPNSTSFIQLDANTNWEWVYGHYWLNAALNSAGELYIWGYDQGWDLDTNNNQLVLLQAGYDVTEVKNHQKVVFSESAIIFITPTGELKYYGYIYGEPDGTVFSAVKTIGTDTDWKSITAYGWRAFHIIKEDGTMWAMGADIWDNLGLVNWSSSFGPTVFPPQQVGTDTFKEAEHTHLTGTPCAIGSDCTAWMWGVRWLDQGETYRSPQKISEKTDFRAIVGRRGGYIAIDSSNRIWVAGNPVGNDNFNRFPFSTAIIYDALELIPTIE